MKQTGISGIETSQGLPLQPNARRNKEMHPGLWILQFFLGLAFIAAGGDKLFDTASTVEMFKKIGVGQLLRYLIGTIEVFGAVTLWNPRYSVFGALLLAAIMLGAVFMHLFVVGGSPIFPVVLFTLLCVIIWKRRRELKQSFNY